MPEKEPLICPTAQVEYFSPGDWTTQIRLNRFMKSQFWRTQWSMLFRWADGLASKKQTYLPANPVDR
jgi:hypothetical protein